jgi:hypothetical protein
MTAADQGQAIPQGTRNVGDLLPVPIPVQSPCASNNCQNTLLKLFMKIPSTCMKLPNTKVGMKSPASSARPEKAPRKKTTHSWIDPTHEIVDGGSSSALT